MGAFSLRGTSPVAFPMQVYLPALTINAYTGTVVWAPKVPSGFSE